MNKSNIPSESLSQPVVSLMIELPTLRLEDSLLAAAEALKEAPTSALPVTDEEGTLHGILSEHEILWALEQGVEPHSAIKEMPLQAATLIRSNQRGAEALRLFESSGAPMLVVVDAVGHVLGGLTPSSLLARPFKQATPPRIGGMATPLGVFLTNGGVAGGASGWGLVLTGMLMFTLFIVSSYLAFGIGILANSYGVGENILIPCVQSLAFILFLLGIRLLPLSGIHGAEHMVVHAIERGEPLVLEVVRRMPRVHPRCGTNLAVGAGLFMGIAIWEWTNEPSLRLLVAALVTFVLWRPLGNFLQFWVTTKRPTDKQLEQGIRAGKELLERYQNSARSVPGLGLRLLRSGMFHVILGALLVSGLANLVFWLFKVPPEWRVQ